MPAALLRPQCPSVLSLLLHLRSRNRPVRLPAGYHCRLFVESPPPSRLPAPQTALLFPIEHTYSPYFFIFLQSVARDIPSSPAALLLLY